VGQKLYQLDHDSYRNEDDPSVISDSSDRAVDMGQS
jgi:hypothetical protein